MKAPVGRGAVGLGRATSHGRAIGHHVALLLAPVAMALLESGLAKSVHLPTGQLDCADVAMAVASR